MSLLSLLLFGPPKVGVDGAPVDLETRKATALLAYLAAAGEPQSRDSLVLLLWPDYARSQGRHVLRQTLYSLNKTLAGEWIGSSREKIGMREDANLLVDTLVFRDLLTECELHGHSADEVCAECREPLEKAINLYRSDFMLGFTLKDSITFDDWQFAETEELQSMLISALDRLIRYLSAKGEYRVAIGHARKWLAMDRMYERAHCRLMELYAWAGQRASALRQYQECLRVLEAEVDTEPLDTTTALFENIKAGRFPDPPEYWHPQEASTPMSIQGPPTERASRLKVPTRRETDVCMPISSAPLEEYRIATVLCLTFLAGRQEATHSSLENVITSYGGIVDRVSDSTMTAVFGAATVHEDDPELAVRAATEAREKAVHAGMGLAAGAYTGGIYLRKSHAGAKRGTASAGSVASHAAKLSEHAGSGQVLVGESTYRLTHGAFDYAPVSLKLRGEERPSTAYRVQDLMPQAKKARGIEGLRAELIGREAEFPCLMEALSDVLTGRGRIVSIIGEAGIGKSRLVAELKAVADGWTPEHTESAAHSPGEDATPVIWLEGRCLETGLSASYWPFIDAFREYLAWRSDDSVDDRAERLVSALQQMTSRGDIFQDRFEEIVPVLGNLLSIRFGNEWDGRLVDVDPATIRSMTFLAVRDFFVALSRRKPLVLVLEDVHWADHHSIDLVSLIMQSLPTARILLICVYRPDREHKCRHIATIATRTCFECFREIVLRELTKQQGTAMVESLLQSERLPASLKEAIINKAQGNPFFLEELVRALIEARTLHCDGGVLKDDDLSAKSSVPVSVQSVVLSRVDRLGSELKMVLQASSAIGRFFSRRLLRSVVKEVSELDKAFRDLETRDIIFKARSIPEEEFSFKHVLTQEAVYQSIPTVTREKLHLRIAESIEVLHCDRLAEQLEQLAYHFDRAGDVVRAVEYHYKAGEKARRNSANTEAINLFSRGLNLLRFLPRTTKQMKQELEYLIAMGLCLVLVESHSSSLVRRTYEQARDLCGEVGQVAQLFEALCGLRRHHRVKGDLDSAIRLSEQLMDLAEGLDDSRYRARALCFMGDVLFSYGAFRSVLEHEERAVATSKLWDDSDAHLFGNDTRTVSLLTESLALWFLGFPEKALKFVNDVMVRTLAIGHPFNTVVTLFYSAWVVCLCRDYAKARNKSQETLRIAAEFHFTLYEAYPLLTEGWARAMTGEVAEGTSRMRHGLEILGSMGDVQLTTLGLGFLAECHLANGQICEAMKALDRAFEIESWSGIQFWQAELHRLKGEAISRYADRRTEAEQCFEKALEVARSHEARSLELRAALSLGRLWRQGAKVEEAQALVQGVFDWFTEGFDTSDLLEAKAFLGKHRAQALNCGLKESAC